MKIITKIMQGAGITLVLIGGAGMDNASIMIPVIMAFSGLGILAAGWGIENAFNY